MLYTFEYKYAKIYGFYREAYEMCDGITEFYAETDEEAIDETYKMMNEYDVHSGILYNENYKKVIEV